MGAAGAYGFDIAFGVGATGAYGPGAGCPVAPRPAGAYGEGAFRAWLISGCAGWNGNGADGLTGVARVARAAAAFCTDAVPACVALLILC